MAAPGFVGGGTPTPEGRAPTYYLAIFPPQLHEDEKNWIRQWHGQKEMCFFPSEWMKEELHSASGSLR